MTRRILLIALVTAGLYALLVGAASAELHRVKVTLITGQTLTVTVDVPPGTPVSSVKIPGLPAPVASITDLGPVATPTPVPTPQVPALPSVPGVPTPTATPKPAKTPDSKKGDNSKKGGSGSSGSTPGTSNQPNTTTGATGKLPKTKRKTAGANTESLVGKVERGKTPDPNNPTQNTDGSPSLANPTISL